jgi:hypothetical protein
MNSVVGSRGISNGYARLLLYGAGILTVFGLAFLYLWTKRSSEVTWWASRPYVNWVRDLHTVNSSHDLRVPLTIMEISYTNGRLSGFCALKNSDPEHGVVVRIAADQEGRLWAPAALQASATITGPWKEIAHRPDPPGSENRVLSPGDAITFNVDLNDYLTALHKYQYGRIVSSSGSATTFDFDLLQPPPVQLPTREEIRKEREREIELTPKK